ncbi:MAG: multidrug ABC transporter ATP-binding protein, partial [Gemmataceae bacterium]|nr:multidrug ABC transporter ATP-binding protein [Gemmataceae bacterium]
PRARIEMRGLLKELRNMGKTILVSSHILPELADICNKIGIIERGKLLFDGDVESAIKQVRQRHRLTLVIGEGRNLDAKGLIEQHSSVDTVEHKEEDDHLIVTLRDGISDGSFLAEMLVKNGYRLKMLKEEEIDLEDVFMGITKGITN